MGILYDFCEEALVCEVFLDYIKKYNLQKVEVTMTNAYMMIIQTIGTKARLLLFINYANYYILKLLNIFALQFRLRERSSLRAVRSVPTHRQEPAPD